MSADGRAAYRAVVAEPERALFAFDFDGTLAPIVADPAEAGIDPGAARALGRLGGLVGGVAIVTGRPARAVVQLGHFEGAAGLHNLLVRGQYGAERWDAATGRFDEPPPPEQMAALERQVPALLDELGLTQVQIEHKGRALGLHTRRTADPQGDLDRLRGPVQELAHNHGMDVEPGRFVLEIRAAGFDKGTTLRELVDDVDARHVVMAGDDLGDLPAFRAAAELRGDGRTALLIRSASEEQQALAELADVDVDGPAGLAVFLEEFCDAIEQAH